MPYIELAAFVCKATFGYVAVLVGEVGPAYLAVRESLACQQLRATV